MKQNNMQDSNKSAAALAFATMLSENLLKQQNQPQESPDEDGGDPMIPEEPMEMTEEPTEDITEEPGEQDDPVASPEEPVEMHDEMKKEQESFMDDIKNTINDGIESIKELFRSKEE